ncbi:MAG: FeoA family protein [Cyanobacteria bacterium J06639_18]
MNNNENLDSNFNSPETGKWAGFQFFCGAQSRKINFNSRANLISLSETQLGDVVCIVEINPIDCIDYLLNMGFTIGTELQVISVTKTGSVVVNLNDKCLGLGADMASSIFVKRFS